MNFSKVEIYDLFGGDAITWHEGPPEEVLCELHAKWHIKYPLKHWAQWLSDQLPRLEPGAPINGFIKNTDDKCFHALASLDQVCHCISLVSFEKDLEKINHRKLKEKHIRETLFNSLVPASDFRWLA
ncbi:MAG: hypothetical protein PHW69_09110 [Elusimicrobiaceae bacterium]|nr:hypothetical protein [Elusimicrobiaceae bacterium]